MSDVSPPPARPPIPRPALVYGLAGLTPFVACTAILLLHAEDAELAVAVEALYAAIILSFLGGARWGLEIPRTPPRATVITLTMAPSVLGFGTALWTMGGADEATNAVVGLLALAALFVATGVWDVTSPDVPAWYPRLRILLTAVVAGLLAVSAAVAAMS